MNKKAELFQKYIEEKQIVAFAMEEIKDELNTVVFRSQIEESGKHLPTIIVLDDSVFGIIRILVEPKVLSKNNEVDVFKLLNQYNKKFKPLKYYLDDEGNLMLDCCIISKNEEFNGDIIYAMIDMLLHHLNESYKEIMSSVWTNK